MPTLATLRLRRHLLGALLLGLWLALLPLRGWAETAMALGTAPGSDAAVMPCHAAMADTAEATEATPGAEMPGCALCALCHGAALVIATTAVPTPLAGQAGPPVLAQGHRAPAPARLERPPRG